MQEGHIFAREYCRLGVYFKHHYELMPGVKLCWPLDGDGEYPRAFIFKILGDR